MTPGKLYKLQFPTLWFIGSPINHKKTKLKTKDTDRGIIVLMLKNIYQHDGYYMVDVLDNDGMVLSCGNRKINSVKRNFYSLDDL